MKPQSPVRRRTGLRKRDDFFRVPVGPVMARPTRPEPLDAPGDWSRYAADPEPFSWAELRDPEIIVGGLALFVALCAIAYLLWAAS